MEASRAEAKYCAADKLQNCLGKIVTEFPENKLVGRINSDKHIP